jgi:hypothetical protein
MRTPRQTRLRQRPHQKHSFGVRTRIVSTVSFRVPGLDLQLPLRARPISGAMIGAVTALALGFVHRLSKNPEGGATARSGLTGGVHIWERPRPPSALVVKPGEPDITIDSRDT